MNRSSNIKNANQLPNAFRFEKHKRYPNYICIITCILFLIGWGYGKPDEIPQWIDLLLQATILLAGMVFLIQRFKTQTLLHDAKVHQAWHLMPASFEVLSNQITSGLNSSETAVISAINKMTQIQTINTALHKEASSALSRTSEITQEIQQLSVQSRQALNSFLEQQGMLSQLQTKKDENIAQAMEDISTLIGPLVDVIRNIAQQTQLLSFNAAIEAARAGPEGSGFKIVATAVRELAKQTTEAAKKIEDGISSVQKAANLNSVSYSKEIADTLQSMQTMHTLLEMNMNHSNSLLPFLLELSQNMDQGTSEIKSHVLDVLAQMQFQDILKQILEQVEKSLSALSEYSHAKINGDTFHADLDEILNSWKESYVILEQRIAHANATAATAENNKETKPQEIDSGPKIELF